MEKKPRIVIGPATALGLKAFSANGRIHPHGSYTTHYFEYGTSQSYGHKTLEQALPSSLGAFYRETWEANTGGWGHYGPKMSHHREEGAARGFIRASEPSFYNDFNHEGCEVLHLAATFYPGTIVNSGSSDFYAPGAYLGGGDPDLRDARVSVSIRGHNFKANGAELIWWSQSQSNIEKGDGPGENRSNWGHTGFLLTDLLQNGKWQRVEYRLAPDTTKWTFGGYNSRRGQERTRKYTYWPIDQVLRHTNCNVIQLLAFVDPKNPPNGAIDLDDFVLAYRNRSLIYPANGGRLIDWPKVSKADPATLTDGWRNGEGRQWESEENPKGPQEFVYAFEKPVNVHTVQLHQNPQWPAKDVEVLTSLDGNVFAPLVKASMPEKGDPNDNFAFSIHRGLKAEARNIKIRVLSGYRQEHWGLGEIEVFGTGATFLPENEETAVTADLHDLKPGTTYHYRLVARNEAGISYGEDRTFTTPATAKPLAATGRAWRITGTAARVDARINPLGVLAHYHFEYGTDQTYGKTSRRVYAGEQITPRCAFADLTGLEPAKRYHYRVVVENKVGKTVGEDATFVTGKAQAP